MEQERAPTIIVAVYNALTPAEEALHALQEAGIPYPNIELGAAAPADLGQLPVAEALPEQLWTLTVALDDPDVERVAALLYERRPLAIGRARSRTPARSDADRGALAWRHYVFESPAAADQIGDTAGTTGTTGITSSGVFAEGARAEGNPPATGAPPTDQRPDPSGEPPTTNDMKPRTDTTSRSRPQTVQEPHRDGERKPDD